MRPFGVIAVALLPAWNTLKPFGREEMTDIIDQTKTFRLLQQRIAKTTNPRHLLMLNRLLQHTMGEAELHLDLVMSTLCSDRVISPGAHRRI